MALPVLTISDLADFKGRDEASFGFFASTAMDLAAFLVETVAPVDFLDDEDIKGQKLFTYATLDLAYALYIEQEYTDINLNPFSSETIGSYSYSKSQAANQFLADPVESSIWMKLLEAYLASQRPNGSPNVEYGGIVGMEYDGVQLDGQGNIIRILGPKHDIWYFDNVHNNVSVYSDNEKPHY